MMNAMTNDHSSERQHLPGCVLDPDHGAGCVREQWAADDPSAPWNAADADPSYLRQEPASAESRPEPTEAEWTEFRSRMAAALPPAETPAQRWLRTELNKWAVNTHLGAIPTPVEPTCPHYDHGQMSRCSLCMGVDG